MNKKFVSLEEVLRKKKKDNLSNIFPNEKLVSEKPTESPSALRIFLEEQINILEKEAECTERIPDDIFMSLQFTDGHTHHLLPSHNSAIEMVKDFLALEKISIPEIKENSVPEKNPIIFKNRQAIGDILMFTCAIRDFAQKFPDWPINVHSTVMHIWDNNPYLTRDLTPENAEIIEVGPSFLTNASNRDDRHFANAFRLSIEEKLGISIPQGAIKPDIWMTEEEISALPIVAPPYWIIVAGEKGDWTAKTYPFKRWEEFVQKHPEITFVQIGAKEHRHPHLSFPNVINLIGKTQDRDTGFRDLLKLFYHAEGSIGLVSFQMHLAAAFNLPCVVVAGAREPARFTRYPGHQYLCTDGCLPCAEKSACWHCDLEKRCKFVVEQDGQKFPKCVDIITVSDIDRAFMQYYQGKRLSLNSPRVPVLPNPIVKKEGAVIHKANPASRPKIDQTIPQQWGMEWGGGCITDLDYKFIKSIIETYQIKTVLEFGAGLSTLLFNQMGLEVDTYETSLSWIEKIRSFSPKANLFNWDGKDLEINKRYDLVFVDGPAGGQNREFSTQIASVISDKVIIHDAGREWEKKWQEKYLSESFELNSKGGHRCHFWLKKTSEKKQIVNESKPKIEFSSEKKIVTVVFNGRGEGGAERSTTWIMNRLAEKGFSVRYIHPGQQPSGTFRKQGNLEKIFTSNDLSLIKAPCDYLFLYTNDWVWEFDKEEVSNLFTDLEAKRKVLAVNFRIGKIGSVSWTQGWDQYLFLNSDLKSAFITNYFKGKSMNKYFSFKANVLPPPTDLTEFYKTIPDYSEDIKLIRHSSQNDSKYPKNFNDMVERILEEIPGSEIFLMPAPSFLRDFGERVHVYKKNIIPINEFLKLGNCFWYILPEGYTEGAGKVIMEAQASGLPVIADNHSGPKEWVREQTGFLCNSFDDHLLSIRKMGPYTRELFGRNSRNFAKDTYDPEKWVNYILGEN